MAQIELELTHGRDSSLGFLYTRLIPEEGNIDTMWHFFDDILLLPRRVIAAVLGKAA